MTAEIAVANKSAVALAADSKVTIGGARNAKTYDTVNKVFTLSKHFPVGIMIFGNAEFMGYPWETIIKLYRRDRGTIEKDLVKDWSEDFQEYIESFGRIAAHHKEINIQGISSTWLTTLEDAALDHASKLGVTIPSNEYEAILLSTIEAHKIAIGDRGVWMTKSKGVKFVKKNAPVIQKVIQEQLGVSPESDVFKAALEFIISAILRVVDSPQSSGFVIAGFGKKEFFPTIIEHNTDGFVGDDLKLSKSEPKDVSRGMSGYIGAFAQKEIVMSFMNGYDSTLFRKITGGFSEAVEDSCLAILEQHGLRARKTDAIRDEIRTAVRARVNAVIQEVVADSQERFSGPVIQMVGLLPKDELAHLAESLVALTSLRRRVSRDVETVGGPIDVALISKGDGFVWIKRKHYFDPSLNPQFIRNYMTDSQSGR